MIDTETAKALVLAGDLQIVLTAAMKDRLTEEQVESLYGIARKVSLEIREAR